MNADYLIENGNVTIRLAGRVDSANAAQVEQRITEIREKAPGAPVVLDCADLTYISSAGLRVILRLLLAQHVLHRVVHGVCHVADLIQLGL